jgi:hypothetical protein
MEISFFASPPTPLQLEMGALLPGFMGVRWAKHFVWVFPLSHERELPSPCRGRVGDGALVAKWQKQLLQVSTPK